MRDNHNLPIEHDAAFLYFLKAITEIPIDDLESLVFKDETGEIHFVLDPKDGVFDFKNHDVINAGNISGGGEAGEDVFEFTEASDIWSINHGYDRHPDVTITQDGSIVEAEVVYVDTNNIEIRFAQPETGKVYLSF